jgi:hypothetical protein
MRIVYYCCFILFFLQGLRAAGQERLTFIAFETGIEAIACKEAEKDYIRTDATESYGGNNGLFGNDGALYRRIRNEMHKLYIGVNAEVRTRNNFAGLITGLRLMQVVGSIEKANGPPDSFFLRLRQTETTTEYLKVERLEQYSTYLGVPLEVRVFAYRQRPFRLFFLVGGEVGYQLSTTNMIDFDNSNMEVYRDDVSQIMGRPDRWYTTFYGRAGFTLGREIPYVTVGITTPVIISEKSSTLNEPTVGIGFHVQVRLPF